MPRNRSKVVPEGIGLPHHNIFESDQLTMADLYRMITQEFDRLDKLFDDLT